MRRYFVWVIVVVLAISSLGIVSYALPTTSNSNYGQVFGSISGQVNGYRDYYLGKNNDWAKTIPTDASIVAEYNLDKESLTYRHSFLLDFRTSFRQSYEASYRAAKFNSKLESYSQGYDYGSQFGSSLGEVYGKRDYYSGKSNNWKSALPSDDIIIKEYLLTRDTKEYRDGFVKGYKDSFEENYTKGYRESNILFNQITKEKGAEHGQSIGNEIGSIQGRIDYYDKLSSNWKRSLTSDKEITEQYNLLKDKLEYRDGFIIGYKEGYMAGYIEGYQQANIELAKGNINYYEIPIKGGKISSTDNILTLQIKEGTFYTKSFITIENNGINSSSLGKNHSLASYTYHIKIANGLNLINVHKTIPLSFEYYGPQNSGIYELVNNKWVYLPSKIEKGFISTEVKLESIYLGRSYAVIIDSSYKPFSDTINHWAYEEIDTLFRRGLVSGQGNNTFSPNQNITRAQFIAMLDRVFNWPSPSNTVDLKAFKDYSLIGSFEASIAKAVANGYIKGYSDSTFRPNMPITYQEVEWIMARLSQGSNFKWKNIADKMMYEEFVRCKSYDDMNQYITRAEIAYMLYGFMR